MNTLNIAHIAINVICIEESVIFYQKVLCLTKLNCIDMEDHLIQYFDLGKGIKLELIRYTFDSDIINTTVVNKGIYRHLALVTNDIYYIYERVLKYNVTVDNCPTFQNKLGFTNLLIRDPNGLEIEIIQYK